MFRTRVGIVVLGLVVTTTVACGDSSDDPKPSSYPASSNSPSTSNSPSSTTPACVETPSTKDDEHTAYVYWYCINDIQPVPVELSQDADPVVALVAAYLAGPTKAQQSLGYHGGLPPGVEFDLHEERDSINIDLDADTLSIELFLAGAFPVERPLSRTVREHTGVSRVTLTIDGATPCELDEECSRP